MLDVLAFLPADGPLRDPVERAGFEPWWIAPNVHIDSFRPITALNHLIDQTLCPQIPSSHHAHIILRMCAPVWTLKCLYRIFEPSGLPLDMVLFFVVVDDDPILSVAWLANRNAIVAAVFFVLAIESYIN